MRVSGSGLREGLIYSYLVEQGINVDDPLDFSLRNQMYNYDLNQPHAKQVTRLSLQLYEQLQELHDLEPEMVAVLKPQAMLPSSGLAVRYYNYHLHSFYLILNSGINGLSQRELLMAAYVGSSSRQGKLQGRSGYVPQAAGTRGCDPDSETGLILRVAKGLDRTMCGRVEDLQININAW